MQVVITYFETGTKKIKEVSGDMFFGDALLGDYLGVKTAEGYTLVPSATVVKIYTNELDEELFTIHTESIKRSKRLALRNMESEMDREDANGRPFHG